METRGSEYLTIPNGWYYSEIRLGLDGGSSLRVPILTQADRSKKRVEIIGR